ncbi:MAG: hypothetical protein ABUL77_02330, partial [Bacteroidota bacterium]
DLERFARATTTSVREAFARMVGGKRLVLNIIPDESAPISGDDDDGDGGDGGPDAGEDGSDIDTGGPGR